MTYNQPEKPDPPQSGRHLCYGNRAARRIAAAFVLYGLTATFSFGLNIPPFQNADEPFHFMRAAQIADGEFVGTRFAQALPDGRTELTGGGAIDPALLEAAKPFAAIRFHPEVKAKRADWAPGVHWSDARALESFPTANYPPFFYLPSTAGILAGREFGLSVVQTLYLSRLLTGLAAVALGALAIAIAGGASPWVFTILTLPMSLSLMASASQDALMIACGALAGALLVRGIRSQLGADNRLLAGLSVALSLIAMARPPFAALALLPLGLPQVQLWRRVLACSAVIICTLFWAGIAAATSMSNFGAIVGADPSAQLQMIRHDPFLIIKVIWATITQTWEAKFTDFIGVLGWLDTLLPHAYYVSAAAMLGIAAVAGMLGTTGKRMMPGNYLPVAGGIVLACLAVLMVQYATWTAPGHAVVEGIEGRYFLAPALVAAALLPSLGRIHATRLRAALLALITVFPTISLAVTMHAVVLRYYLG